MARSCFELLVGHCVGCFCLFSVWVVPGVGVWFRLFIAFVGALRCLSLRVWVCVVQVFAVWEFCLHCFVGVALFGWGVVCRAVPHSQLVGFRRGVYYFSCASFVAAGCVARDVLFGVRACAFASSVRGGQGTRAHELYEPPRGNKVDGLPRAASKTTSGQNYLYFLVGYLGIIRVSCVRFG